MPNRFQVSDRMRPIVLLSLMVAFLLLALTSMSPYPSQAKVSYQLMATATPLAPCSPQWPICGSNIYPIADAYTDRTFPDWNFGASTRLNVSSDARLTPVYESFLKFDLGMIPAGRTFVSAYLYMCGKLESRVSGTTVPVRIFDVSNGWQESTVTWTNRPIIGTHIANGAISVGTAAEQGYYCSSWNISSYVIQKLRARTPIVSLGVRSGYGSLYYISKEFPNHIPAQGHAVGKPVIQTAWRVN